MMACDFCNEKTALTNGNFIIEVEDGMLRVSYECSDTWYNSDACLDVNYCPMCGRDLRGDSHE